MHPFFVAVQKNSFFFAASYDIHASFTFQFAWKVPPFFCATSLLWLHWKIGSRCTIVESSTLVVKFSFLTTNLAILPSSPFGGLSYVTLPCTCILSGGVSWANDSHRPASARLAHVGARHPLHSINLILYLNESNSVRKSVFANHI